MKKIKFLWFWTTGRKLDAFNAVVHSFLMLAVLMFLWIRGIFC